MVKDRSIYLEEYARGMISQEELHSMELRKMLRDFKPKRSKLVVVDSANQLGADRNIILRSVIFRLLVIFRLFRAWPSRNARLET